MASSENSQQSKAKRQGKGHFIRTPDVQRMQSFPTDLEEKCIQLAKEVADIPALVREHISNVDVSKSHERFFQK